MAVSLKHLKKVRCRFLDKATSQPLAGIVATLSVAQQDKSRLPIAALRSDATGYLSFDLQPLLKHGVDNVAGLLISAPQIGLASYNVLESFIVPALNEDVPLMGESLQTDNSRTLKVAAGSRESTLNVPPVSDPGGKDCLCIEFPIYAEKVPLESAKEDAGCLRADLPSIQSPDRCDYALSPYSFVIPAKSSLGATCCETLAPATLPVQEHEFYRVVVRRNPPSETGAFSLASVSLKVSGTIPSPTQAIARAVDITKELPIPEPTIKFAQVLEYRQRWDALGHSLGEIKYSLPLAPGESMQLAVIEWSRDDSASRYDQVRGTEYLQHDLRRDRSLDESVDAGLKETQSGWSWAGGLSSGMAYDAKAYGQYTGNWAAGGGTSNSSGERDLKATSGQDLHDHVVQGTSYVRSLTSTVVLQASQAEQNALQTRRVANHNHCHALTIEYYEVLRHFRLRTEFVRTRQAVLIPFTPFDFRWDTALRFETILSQVLLDPSLSEAFDAVKRLELGWGYQIQTTPPTTTPTKGDESYFVGSKENLKVIGTEALETGLRIQKGSTVRVTATGEIKNDWRNVNGWDPDGGGEAAPEGWYAPGLSQFSLVCRVGPNQWYQGGANEEFVPKEDGFLVMQFNDVKGGLGNNPGFWTVSITVLAPPSNPEAPTPTDPSKGSSGSDASTPTPHPDPSTPTRERDAYLEAVLLNHLKGNRGFYNRAVWILMDPTERRLYLEEALGSGSDVLAAIDDKPIATSGNYVAFLYNAPTLAQMPDDEPDPDPLESIVTLPTRGVFAEAQLGHCNSCEKRDVTRMWNWTEMTTEEPPAISAIQPGPKGQMPTLTPSQLPANVIQITQPQAAPDPTAMANALGVLKTPSIFRDMSGLDQASAILGKLVDGTNKTLDDMVKGASQAKEKVDAARKDASGPSGSDGTAGSNGTSPKDGASGSNGTSPKGRTQPNEKDAAAQVDKLQAIEDAKQRNLITDQQANDAAQGVLGGQIIQTASIDRNISMPMGIDVSHNQGIINWDKVASSSIYFAFIKASDGQNFLDPKFQTNWQRAREAGLTCGAYHFWRPQVPGKQQAELLIRQLGFLQRGDLPPVLDVEEGDDGLSNFTGLTAIDLENNIQEFIETIRMEFGVLPMIYTNPGFWTNPNRMGNSSKFSTHLLWIANYDPKSDPTLPGGWPTWEFWQMTASGRVEGATGGKDGLVDMNMFNGDLTTLWQMAGRNPKSIQT